MSEQASKRASEQGPEQPVRVRTFRDLIAWQRAIELAEAIYKVTSSLPGDERFGLVSQMRRAAVSVPSNIAEGHGRQTRTDYLRFLRMARGSLAELETQLVLAERLGLLRNATRAWELLREEARILHALINKLAAKGGVGS